MNRRNSIDMSLASLDMSALLFFSDGEKILQKEMDVVNIFNDPINLGHMSNQTVIEYAKTIGLVCDKMICIIEAYPNHNRQNKPMKL